MAGLDPLAERAVYREAGLLLRLFHDAEAPVPWPDFAADRLTEFERWADRASGLLTTRELDFARAEVRALADLSPPARVPCHLDYTDRNWLTVDGRVHVIDFERARPDVWINDLARLHYGRWRARPDLRESFLDGYGRQISEHDHAILVGHGALTAVSTVVWAREHDDAPFENAGRRSLRDLMDPAP